MIHTFGSNLAVGRVIDGAGGPCCRFGAGACGARPRSCSFRPSTSSAATVARSLSTRSARLKLSCEVPRHIRSFSMIRNSWRALAASAAVWSRPNAVKASRCANSWRVSPKAGGLGACAVARPTTRPAAGGRWRRGLCHGPISPRNQQIEDCATVENRPNLGSAVARRKNLLSRAALRSLTERTLPLPTKPITTPGVYGVAKRTTHGDQ